MLTFNQIAKKDTDSSTGLLFMQVYNKWHTEIKNELRLYEITHPQFVIMSTIGYLMEGQEEITQVMIANLSGIDVMSTSQILKLLEKKKVIERCPHSKDTRANAIKLTSIGRAKLEQTLPVVESIDQVFFGSLKEDEKQLILLLKRL